jgi:hypothetical protein
MPTKKEIKSMFEFEPWPKMGRLFRDIVVTEKLDGTNAQVYIPDDLSGVHAGSRTRWITPEDDNFGFAKWVEENKDELLKLGPGRHFGEWWGAGIQRRYGLTERRFSLFNTLRWNEDNIPSCCSVVPVMYQGGFSEQMIEDCIDELRGSGSVAVPGFMNPEGIIVYHTAARVGFKYTLDGDGHKGDSTVKGTG